MFYFDGEKEKIMDKVNFCNKCQLKRTNNRSEGCFVYINCDDCEFCPFPAVNYREMPSGRICQYSYKRINHLKVRLRRFQAVESENVPEKVYDIINRDLRKRRIRWGHSYDDLWIPNSINNFRTLIPAVRLRPLNLLSASSVNLHGLANTSIFHNNLRVMLFPLKSPVLRKYSNPFKRPGMYPSITKCNAKRCNCCMHLCTNSTVTSSVNGRKFSVVNHSDLD